MKDSPTESIKAFIGRNRIPCTGALTAFLCGLITHLYIITNKFYNYFEMGNIFSTMPYEKSDTLAMGRVFLPIVTAVSGYFSSAAINGVLALTVIAIAVYMLVDCLKLRSMLFAALAGGIVVTFPGIASYLSYGVNSDIFCISMCLAVGAVWLTQKYRRGYIGGALCMCISLGCYQPFLSVAIAVVFAILLLDVLRRDVAWKELVLKSLKYLGMMVVGFILYYVLLQIALKVTGITMGSYHGVDEMTSFTLKGLVKGFVYAYIYFLRYFFTTAYNNGLIPTVANYVAAVVLLLLLVRAFRQRKKSGKTQMILLFCLFPLGVNAAPFLMGDRVGSGVDNYMLFSVIMTYLLLLAVMETVAQKWSDQVCLMHTAEWTVVITCAVTVISGFYVCNMAYHRLDAATQEVAAFLNRTAVRIEETQEWQEGMPVYFAGSSQIFNDHYEVSIPEFEELKNVSGTEIKPWYSYEAVYKYMKEYLHFPLGEVTKEQIQMIEGSAELSKMPVYPAEGSIAEIDGVLVVKIGSSEN